MEGVLPDANVGCPQGDLAHDGSMGRTGLFTYMKTIKISLFCREIYHTWMVWVATQIFFYSGRKSLPKNQRLPVGDFPVFSPNFENPPKSSRKLVKTKKKGGGGPVRIELVPKDSGDDCCHQGLNFQFFPPPMYHWSTGCWCFFPTHLKNYASSKSGSLFPKRKTHRVSAHFWTSQKAPIPKGKGFFVRFWHHFWCQQNVRFKSRGWGKDGSCFSK